MQRNPACSDSALLLRPEQRLKGNCLPEVNVEASRFMELQRVGEGLSVMYDAGQTGLIMIPLAALLSRRLCEPGEPWILPSVLMLTNSRTDQAPSREKAVRVSLLCYCGLAVLLSLYVRATATTSWGTVKHLSPLLKPQRTEKQVQSVAGLTYSRCHKKAPRHSSNQ